MINATLMKRSNKLLPVFFFLVPHFVCPLIEVLGGDRAGQQSTNIDHGSRYDQSLKANKPEGPGLAQRVLMKRNNKHIADGCITHLAYRAAWTHDLGLTHHRLQQDRTKCYSL